MKIINLVTEGFFTVVDDSWYEILLPSTWYVCGGYAGRWKNGTIEYMHSVIKPPQPGLEINHINRLKFDNRDSNLKLVTSTENQRNRKPRQGGSGVSGVVYHTKMNKWQADITVNGKRLCLGTFSSFEEAVEVRLSAEKRWFGKVLQVRLTAEETGLTQNIFDGLVRMDKICRTNRKSQGKTPLSRLSEEFGTSKADTLSEFYE